MKSKRPLVLDQSILTLAVEHLRMGELVAFPTETVYGLGADANNEAAIKKLYATKGRPGKHPVIVHLASFEQISDWGKELPEYARLLAKDFWPGPLTLIVKKAKHVSPLLTGGQDTVGLRVPAHPLALALLKVFGGGIAAPSANKYGRISATSAAHVQEEFGEEVSLIIDGGNCPIGIESTIVDVTGAGPRILRPGIILEQEILQKISSVLGNTRLSEHSHSTKPIRVPGSDKTHYAPHTPVLLLDQKAIESLLTQREAIYGANNKLSYAVLAFSGIKKLIKDELVKKYIESSIDVRSYARDIYANLRKLDNTGANYIIVQLPPESAEWAAIHDRLKRAATRLQP